MTKQIIRPYMLLTRMLKQEVIQIRVCVEGWHDSLSRPLIIGRLGHDDMQVPNVVVSSSWASIDFDLLI